MTKAERNKIIKWANTLTNEELEKEYYDSVFDCLGSQAEEMYERGWCMEDIREREKFEKYLCQQSDLLEQLCEERGIKLWEGWNQQVEENADKPVPLYYLETKCPNCGRLRVEHWSNGKDICEKCLWCIQDEDYYWELDL